MNANHRAEKPLGFLQVADVSASTALTVPAGAVFALITPEGQGVRWRDDGVAPTASVGYPLGAGSELEYTGSRAAFAALRFIGQAAGAKLNVVFYGYDQ